MITIKRDWNNPVIELEINKDGIKISCAVEEFIKAFKNNLPKMTWDFKTETINSKCEEALIKTLEQLKAESVKIITKQ